MPAAGMGVARSSKVRQYQQHRDKKVAFPQSYQIQGLTQMLIEFHASVWCLVRVHFGCLVWARNHGDLFCAVPQLFWELAHKVGSVQ